MSNEKLLKKETFVMPQVKCKSCGKIVSKPFLHKFSFSFDSHMYHGLWCLCNDCIEKGINRPKCLNSNGSIIGRDAVKFLSEMSQLISQYQVNRGDTIYEDENFIEKNMFLDRRFEYGGTVGQLYENKGNYFGVYIVVIPNNFGKICFYEKSNSGCWKGKDPTVSIDILQDKWIDNTNILYIGKSSSKFVKKRMMEHIKFWNGTPISAYGGRIIGQLQNFENLEVWYLKSDNPDKTEKTLIQEFKAKHNNKRPFANWRD